MKNREYQLIVKKPIYGSSHIDVVYYRIGDVMEVNHLDFETLKRGETIKRLIGPGGEAIISFDKYNFENEVKWIDVTIEYGVGGLGQRK